MRRCQVAFTPLMLQYRDIVARPVTVPTEPTIVDISTYFGCIGVSAKRSSAAGVVGGNVADLNVCRAGVRVADDGAIDDFEDGNNQLSLEGGRDGGLECPPRLRSGVRVNEPLLSPYSSCSAAETQAA